MGSRFHRVRQRAQDDPPLLDPLGGSEIRVLRCLPTHLSVPEITGELPVSTSTVKTGRTPTLSQAMPDNFEPNGPWFTALAPV